MVEKIVNELKDFYNLPYFYSVKFGGGSMVVLGDKPCICKDKSDDFKQIEYDANFIYRLFQNDLHTDTEKYNIACKVKNLISNCRCLSLKTFDEQKNFIKQLNEEELKEIYNQIVMYKKALEYYQIYKDHIF